MSYSTIESRKISEMEINELTDLVIERFNGHDGYVETDQDHMREVIDIYLSEIYKYDLEYAVIKLEHDRVLGKIASKDDYIKEIKKAEHNLIIQAERLSVGSKKELDNLV